MHVGSLDLLLVRALAMPVGSCKLKLGVEKRDADNFACAMALGPKIGPLAEVVGVAFFSFAVTPTSNVCWNRPVRPTRTDAMRPRAERYRSARGPLRLSPGKLSQWRARIPMLHRRQIEIHRLHVVDSEQRKRRQR